MHDPTGQASYEKEKKMPLTRFPHGVSSFGIPIFGDGSRFSSPWSTHYFVDGDNGSDGNRGTEPTKAFKTIQKAVTASTAQDVIYIRAKSYTIGTGFARYTEDVTSTLGGNGGSGVAALNANKTIIGVTPNAANSEYGGVRWKHASATNLTVDSPALHVENIGFFSEGATYGVLLRNDGATYTQRGSDGASFYNCVFKGKGLYVLSGGDGVTIQNCRFHCAYDGTVAQLNYSCSANPGRRLLVRNCEWQDGNGTTSSGPCITIAAPLTELLIRDCYFGQLPTGNVYIATSGANYGLIANCYFNHDDLDTDAEITLGTGVTAVGCYDAAGIATAA